MKPPPSVLVVDDDAAFRQVLAGELGRLQFTVTAAGSGPEALQKVAELEPQIVLLDLQMPGMSGLEVLRAIRESHPGSEVIMLTGHGSIDTAIESIRIGAFDYVMKPCPLDELELRIQRALERQQLKRHASLLERGLTPPDLGGSFIGDSPQFRNLLALIDRVAPTDSTVLITGETGSGKEMVAKLIHARSLRRARPFVVIECAALQESLLQSELFGHERGAFTGADRAKPGLFEVAHRGTIFLDEIGEVSQATQVKLLRVLDTSTFRHVGGTSEIRVDVRVLAATNRDLPAMVRGGLFREDLYYRLGTISVELPPLRERTGDVDLLAAHFVAAMSQRFGIRRRIGPAALDVLRRHHWPGNVRELLHVIESASIVCEGEEILPRHLPATLRASVPAAPPSSRMGPAGAAPGSTGPSGAAVLLAAGTTDGTTASTAAGAATGTAAGTATSTAAGAATGTAAGAATGTATGAATSTAAGTATSTAAGTATGTAAGTATSTAAGTAAGAATGTAAGASTGTTASTAAGPPGTAAGTGTELPTLERLEREHIERALSATAGHRGSAAKILGISERNLYRKLREYKLLP